MFDPRWKHLPKRCVHWIRPSRGIRSADVRDRDRRAGVSGAQRSSSFSDSVAPARCYEIWSQSHIPIDSISGYRGNRSKIPSGSYLATNFFLPIHVAHTFVWNTGISDPNRVPRPVLDIASAGSGFQQVLMLLAFLNTRTGSPCCLLDEPDAHLHM